MIQAGLSANQCGGKKANCIPLTVNLILRHYFIFPATEQKGSWPPSPTVQSKIPQGLYGDWEMP